MLTQTLKFVRCSFFLLLICLQFISASLAFSAKTSDDIERLEITVDGLFVRIEHLPSFNSSTPVVLIVPGLGGSVNFTATLQDDITGQGYSTVSFTEANNNNNTQFVINEKNHIDILLNRLIQGTFDNIGNTSNILLLGQSAGGGSVLTFSNDTRIIGVLAVVPANFGLPTAVNTRPVGIILGDKDLKYKNDGLSYYDNLFSPKWYCNIRNGTHYLGITDQVEDLPTSFTPIVEKYIFAWLDWWQRGDENALRLLTLEGSYDYNLLYVESQGIISMADPTPSITPTSSRSSSTISNNYALIVITGFFLIISLIIYQKAKRAAKKRTNLTKA